MFINMVLLEDSDTCADTFATGSLTLQQQSSVFDVQIFQFLKLEIDPP